MGRDSSAPVFRPLARSRPYDVCMSELANIPGVIPHMEAHDGPRRTLTVISDGAAIFSNRTRPVIVIDGRAFQVMWGPITFEIPADRNVHLSAHVLSSEATGFASMLLEAGGQDEQVAYKLRSMSNLGEFQRMAYGY